MKKSLTFLENTIVYLVILIISVNWSWIIYEQLKFVKLTRDPLPYTAFLINRSIAIPLIIVITLNFVMAENSRKKTMLYAAGSVTILTLLVVMGNYFGITTLINWNLAFDVMYFIGLHLIAYYVWKFFHQLEKNEVQST
ncbi:hypothetical protein [Paenibacillus turpanensis]|uniref:hypothetical protein n=1 Tax=Paenibacillus turpanensis TaxID=2689078 RepID=UPI001A9EEFCB|nr:hypothetical protein [Paenibacillus turpanensis]